MDSTIVLDRKQMADLLEGTFRRFQMGFRGPSHVWPPFRAKAIDLFTQAATAVPALGEGVPIPVNPINLTIPAGAWRGVFTGIGMAAESQSAWADLQWDITINGLPTAPYAGIRGQLGPMSRPAPIYLPFQSRNVVGIRVTNQSNNPHLVMARLTGWFYEVRSECGDDISSTIVD